jgi:SpoVK/Ycf46/Vps4 family AAA+-type ATPase
MEDNDGKADWEQYISSDQFKEDLKDIAQTVDPAVQQRIRDLTCATAGICSTTGTEAIKFPLVLFHGPPGTGKTEAMRLLASESGLTPWVLDMKGLNLGYGAEDLFAKSLKHASELSDAIVFFDECERLFTRRSVLGESSSVMAQVQKRLVASFIEFADGLETKSLMSQRVIFVFASNLKEDLDPAVLDRVWKDLLFELPGQNEFTTWWSRKARHLNDKEHVKLGALSVGLSYRKVKQIAHQVLVRAARQEASRQQPGVTCQGLPKFEDYELEFARSKDEPSIASWVMERLRKLSEPMWALKNFEFLSSRLASHSQNVWWVFGLIFLKFWWGLSWLCSRSRQLPTREVSS